MERRLLLLRHAQAVDYAPGLRDIDRPLTPAGRAQAERVGELLSGREFLSGQELPVDRVLSSSAVRTRQTAELLGLGAGIEVLDELYQAGSETIRERLATCDPGDRVVLVVGHAPGVPALAVELADPQASDPAALTALQRGFPTATLAGFEVSGDWPHLGGVRLDGVWRG